ncbi:MAG TPA: bifunctional 4-hydroxy-2-oxoglutarate aldolase/2-dehydro-3-deoxy-phosphogluconate aldolase [Caulobacteraceae bacterium]|jgi:2-dehydro-3-deoxyphosphogluconate aldolase/(4S)-4-hydroxy-2-oxoglutarate aldolase|nr:bifunctional 4-hydroxy-2-oxoglutarate aldolase/2-dehydro-3-deoxy-phosphogluconate aldolase [Caulobacteraceae bacterium]
MSARLRVGDIVRAGPVIAVLTIERAADAVPLAGALLAGGVTVLEVTLRTGEALAAIQAIAAEVPEAIVGAGTVLNPKDLQRAEAAGARFIVSPGLTEPLLRAAEDSPLPYLPGVSTVSEVMTGLDAGLNEFKFFPAEATGGSAFLKALHSPLPHCRFCPTGGVTAEAARAYLALPNVPCVGGGWIAPPRSILAGNWEHITNLARAASALPA